MEEIVSKRTQVEKSPAVKDNEEEGKPMVTHFSARHSVPFLQCFVEQGLSDNAHALLDTWADFFYSRGHASLS